MELEHGNSLEDSDKLILNDEETAVRVPIMAPDIHDFCSKFCCRHSPRYKLFDSGTDKANHMVLSLVGQNEPVSNGT